MTWWPLSTRAPAVWVCRAVSMSGDGWLRTRRAGLLCLADRSGAPSAGALLLGARSDCPVRNDLRRIDAASRWATFFNIELPKLQKVLVIAVLLRFMETFMIYTEPFVVTGGGPGSATTFLSIDLVKIALGQVDLGSAAAMSLVYNLITLTLCWIFFTIMTQLDRRRYA